MTSKTHADDLRERIYPKEVSEFGGKVINILAGVYGGIHHLDWKQIKKTDWNGYCIEYNIYHDLSTWDGNELTKFVILCHDECIRLEVNPCNFRYLKLRFHQRTRTGGIAQRHPTIEEQIKLIRKSWS